MKAVTQFARNGKEVDILKSVGATIEALEAGISFEVAEIVEALSAANPTDEDCSDVEFLEGSVSRAVRNTFSNSMSAASMFLCEEAGNGYIRK